MAGKSRVAVLTNGRQFYEAEREAIRAARHSIHVEAYVFRPGHVAERFLDALTERAKAGDVGRLSLMLVLAPVFGLWLAAALFGERIGRVEVAGVVLAVAGTAVVAWEAARARSRAA